MNHGIEGRGENPVVDEQPWNLCVVDRQRISRDIFAWRNHGSPAEAKLQALETELQLLLQTLEAKLQEELQSLEPASPLQSLEAAAASPLQSLEEAGHKPPGNQAGHKPPGQAGHKPPGEQAGHKPPGEQAASPVARLQEKLQSLEAASPVMLQMTSPKMLAAWDDLAFS